jgi:hypothetical protein
MNVSRRGLFGIFGGAAAVAAVAKAAPVEVVSPVAPMVVAAVKPIAPLPVYDSLTLMMTTTMSSICGMGDWTGGSFPVPQYPSRKPIK